LQRAGGGAGIAFLRHFGGADDEKAPVEPWQHEDHPVFRVLQGVGVFLDGLWHVQDDVAAAHEPQTAGRWGDPAHGIDFRHERPSGIDDETRVDAALHPALVHLDRITVGERLDRRHGAAVEDVGAAGAGIEQHGEHEPRVVGLAVVIMQHGVEIFAAKTRQLCDLRRLEAPAWRQPIADRQQVVEA
jgi:hypothetical protein